MSANLKSSDLGGMVAFTEAIRTATDRINGLSASLSTLRTGSGNVALQMSKLSTSAAHVVAVSQAIVTECQCNCKALSDRLGSGSGVPDELARFFIPTAAFLTTLRLLSQGVRWLWTAGAPITRRGLAVFGRVALLIWRTLGAVSEAFTMVAEIARGLMSGLAAWVTPSAIVLTLETVAAVAALDGITYLLWRNWNTIVSTLRTLANTISREAIALMGQVAAFINGDSESISERDLGLIGGVPKRRGKWARLASHFAKLSSIQSSVGPRYLLSGGALRSAGLVMLAAPLLAAPTLAAAPSRQAGIDGTRAASIVINSSPTVTVNCSDLDDIQPRILEALRQHREEIYEQWCSEVRRRQRTEF